MNPIRKAKHVAETNEMWWSLAIVVIVGGIYLLALGQGLMSVIDMPDVHMSNSTGECVEVINYHPDDAYTCDNLPERYNHVWVK